MPESVEHYGQVAGPGFAQGPVYLARAAGGEADGAVGYLEKGSVEAELDALRAAIITASEAIMDLLGKADEEAGAILEFQVAMLEDDTFIEAAASAIASGSAADAAWRAVLDGEIENYLSSDDDYFRARSADLIDIRDRVLAALTGSASDPIPNGCIYVGDDISPTRFLSHDWSGGGGVGRGGGSVTSHVSMLARSRGVPCLVGIGQGEILSGSPALLDAQAGRLTVDPDDAAIMAFGAARADFIQVRAVAAGFAQRPAKAANGEAVEVLVNIADPAEVEAIAIGTVDGVGLMRTEFLFGGDHGLPDEDSQLAAYSRVLNWANGKPVIIRTVDAGADKPVAGFTELEENSFLGVRGIRLCLAKPDIFRVQIRALLRAAICGNLKVMLPMVSVPDELEAALALFAEESAHLQARGIAHAMPQIGIMVEVPSVAITPQRFAKAQFFSIGSNDLTQYVLAASRDNAKLSGLAQASDPAVMALILGLVDHCEASGQQLSLCGDAASDVAMAPLLLDAGLRRLSVAAAQVGAIKEAISRWSPTPSSGQADRAAP